MFQNLFIDFICTLIPFAEDASILQTNVVVITITLQRAVYSIEIYTNKLEGYRLLVVR